MTWQVVLTLILSGVLLLIVIVLGVLLAAQRKKTRGAMADEQKWKNAYDGAIDLLQRVNDEKLAAAMTSEEITDALADLADNWVPDDSAGDDAGDS